MLKLITQLRFHAREGSNQFYSSPILDGLDMVSLGCEIMTSISFDKQIGAVKNLYACPLWRLWQIWIIKFGCMQNDNMDEDSGLLYFKVEPHVTNESPYIIAH